MKPVQKSNGAVGIEQRGRKRKQKRDLRRAVLCLVGAAGIMSLAAVAPNLPAALQKLGMLPTGPKDTGTINRARNKLIRNGLLEKNPDGHLVLTERGRRELDAAHARESARPAPMRWDGRWRILIFDLPEPRKTTRDMLRRSLLHVGFRKVQDSVWAYPYDCEDFVALLKADFKIGKDMLYLIVDEMEGDSELRKTFGLRER